MLKYRSEIDDPNIFKLLTIVASLSISTSTLARSLSTFKNAFEKQYGRKSSNGLAQLYIHNLIIVNPEDVLDEITKKRLIRFSIVNFQFKKFILICNFINL